MTEHVEPDGLMMEARALPPETSFPGAGKAAGGLLAAGALSMPDTSGPGPTALQEPAHWAYDFDPATGSSRATYNGEVQFTSGGSSTAGVTSWNTRTGAVVFTAADLTAAGGLANPNAALTGVPTAPTATAGTSSQQLATTAFVAQAIVAGAGVTSFNSRQGAITLTTGDITGAGGAPSVSPAFTGVPTAPTASQGNASSQIASTQFVANAIASGTVSSFNGRQGAVSLSLSDVQSVGGAPIASPTFTGVPAVPTATPGTATTQAASTAFVTNAISAGTAGVASFNTRTGAVVFTASDLTSVNGAFLASPTFTGSPAAPTPSAGDNSTRIATTAYVETAIGSLPPGVATFNGRQGTVTLQLTDVTSVGGAPLASPVFTGSPLTTTPTPGDNSTRIADTAFVATAIGALPAASTALPIVNGTAAAGSAAAWSRGDHVHPIDATRAPINAPTFTGKTQITGVIDGSNAPAGMVGEVLTANVSNFMISASATYFAALTLPLTAGDWDVTANFAFYTGGTNNVSQFLCGLNNVNAGPNTSAAISTSPVNSFYTYAGPERFNSASPMTVYCMVYAAYTGGAGNPVNVVVRARRMR